MASKLLRVWATQGGINVNGTNYEFDDFDTVTFTYALAKHITRGANSKNKVGIDVQENSKNPDTATVTVLDMDEAMMNLLNDCFKNNIRIDLWFIDQSNLGKVNFNNAKVTAPVRQLNIGEEESNLTVQLSVESFDVEAG